MNIVLLYHSLISDWNHGNAHFLRGFSKELIARGHNVKIFEPHDSWSATNLIQDHGREAIAEFQKYYPTLTPSYYDVATPDYESILSGADVVIVHEWNDQKLVAEVGRLKSRYGYKLLFHDTHHRAVSEAESMGAYDFSNYDGALVFGEVIREIYHSKKWLSKTWTWHEAADTEVFTPIKESQIEGDLVWIGNWGDNERTEELMEFLIRPVKELKLKAKVYGVRYPEEALAALKDAGIEYGGYLPNYKAPEIFSKYRVTVHVPRGPYVKWLPGIPTIRPFEALACGIPLICSPWSDAENLFSPGKDYLMAKDGEEMKQQLRRVLQEREVSSALVQQGLNTVRTKHSCKIRVDELENIFAELGLPALSNQQQTNIKQHEQTT